MSFLGGSQTRRRRGFGGRRLSGGRRLRVGGHNWRCLSRGWGRRRLVRRQALIGFGWRRRRCSLTGSRGGRRRSAFGLLLLTFFLARQALLLGVNGFLRRLHVLLD